MHLRKREVFTTPVNGERALLSLQRERSPTEVGGEAKVNKGMVAWQPTTGLNNKEAPGCPRHRGVEENIEDILGEYSISGSVLNQFCSKSLTSRV